MEHSEESREMVYKNLKREECELTFQQYQFHQ